ncbi:hypothetical protein acdb102_00020 [Acidothermaceae bacterium B102]|nr:hypothetical protein acdb102_00020 [Acidothermaceae bacterium B102]
MRRVYAYARVPTFSTPKSNCTPLSNSSLALWVGMGGMGADGLLQNGWVTEPGTLQGMDPWFEVITQTSDPFGKFNTGLVKLRNYTGRGFVDPFNTAPAGDLVYADTYYVGPSYDSRTGTNENLVQFSFVDTGPNPDVAATILVNDNDAIMRDRNGLAHDVELAWTPEYGEAIDERVTAGGINQLREFGTAGWTNAWGVEQVGSTQTSTPLGNFPWQRGEITSNGSVIGNMTGGNMNPDNESWNFTETSCGQYNN